MEKNINPPTNLTNLWAFGVCFGRQFLIGNMSFIDEMPEWKHFEEKYEHAYQNNDMRDAKYWRNRMILAKENEKQLKENLKNSNMFWSKIIK